MGCEFEVEEKDAISILVGMLHIRDTKGAKEILDSLRSSCFFGAAAFRRHCTKAMETEPISPSGLSICISDRIYLTLLRYRNTVDGTLRQGWKFKITGSDDDIHTILAQMVDCGLGQTYVWKDGALETAERKLRKRKEQFAEAS